MKETMVTFPVLRSVFKCDDFDNFQLDNLSEELTNVREELLDREAEIQHLTEQLEVAAAQTAHTLNQFESDKQVLQVGIPPAAIL